MTCKHCEGMGALVVAGPTYSFAAPCWHCKRPRFFIGEFKPAVDLSAAGGEPYEILTKLRHSDRIRKERGEDLRMVRIHKRSGPPDVFKVSNGGWERVPA